MNQQPDKILLERIMKKIEDSRLISEKILARYSRSIMEGIMTTEDRVLLAESDDEEIKDKGDAKKN